MTGSFPELADLWSRRADLSEDEWTRLYHLVIAVLEANPVREEWSEKLGSERRKALRDSFFIDKVLLPATAPGADPNPELTLRALPVFYRRYLLDQIRVVGRRKESELPADDDGRMVAPKGRDHFGPFGDTDSECGCIDELGEIDSCALQDNARRFLRGEDNWVVVYLALHFCNGRERLPLSKIQRVFRIPSYHYKARQLGIAPPRGGYAGLSQFADTMIGRWLSDNGIALDESNKDVIRHAFDLLCMEAFTECDRRELTDREMER